MTAEEAIKAYKEKFGGLPWGLDSMGDEYIVAAVEKALKTGEEWNPDVPSGVIL